MEDLIKNDATFELYHNSEGGRLLNNRVLLSYPSEKSSFQVDLGGDGYSYFEDEQKDKDKDKDKDKEKRELDPEKVAGAITSGATAVSSIGSTIQAFKGDGTKKPSRRKQLKDVCGRKPLTKKKQDSTGYTKCVAEYNAGKIGGSTDTKAPDTETNTNNNTNETPPKDNKKIIIIGVVVVAVVVTAFIAYKKGLFGKKAV
jgi:hypothetical protein